MAASCLTPDAAVHGKSLSMLSVHPPTLGHVKDVMDHSKRLHSISLVTLWTGACCIPVYPCFLVFAHSLFCSCLLWSPFVFPRVSPVLVAAFFCFSLRTLSPFHFCRFSACDQSAHSARAHTACVCVCTDSAFTLAY